ncbi:MAG: hypothetical protein Kow0010_25960 [Dehalococcoidia bacterium]
MVGEPPASERTALVLGGGGSLGALQVGFIERILALDIPVDFVVGTSVGALNAAYVAFHDAPDHDCLHDIWMERAGSRLFHRSLFRIARQLWRSRLSLYDASPVVTVLRKHLAEDSFGAARVPLHVTATNLCDGRRYIFSEGSILRALRASTAVPGLLPPVEIDGEWFADGAISAPLDIDAALELGATQVIAIDLRPAPARRCPSTVVDVLTRSWEIVTEQRTVCATEHRDHAATIVHIRPGLGSHSAWAFDAVEEHLIRSTEMARAVFDQCWDGTRLRAGHYHLLEEAGEPVP